MDNIQTLEDTPDCCSFSRRLLVILMVISLSNCSYAWPKYSILSFNDHPT